LLLHDETPEAVTAREQSFVLGTYNRAPFHPRSGKGARLVDANGKAYWDLLSGIAVNALGHQHPRIKKIVREESASLLHVSNLYYHPAQGILAEKLVRASGLCRAFFCNSGTEANEAALKFARLANPGRTGLVALSESFHGRTVGSLSLTGHEAYRAPFAPLVPDVTFVEPNDIAALEAAVNENTSAIFLEPVMGEGGVIPLSDEFLIAARRLADKSGAMLVFDEIQCGLGRLGTLFAFQQSGVVPDIVTLAKALGGGLPLGAVLTGPALEGVVKPGHHGTTFGGNPLACRLGYAVVDEAEKMLGKINDIGSWFESSLHAAFGAPQSRCGASGGGDESAPQRDCGAPNASQLPKVLAIRGKGLMWGIELDQPAGPIVAKLRDQGFIVGSARENTIRLLPPYVVPKQALTEFIAALESIVGAKKKEKAA
jgi:acetylornithine/succinyldiaminopimelate/putrescine aminotransferase